MQLQHTLKGAAHPADALQACTTGSFSQLLSSCSQLLAASHSFLSSRYTLWSTSMASSLAGSPDSFISRPPNDTSSSTCEINVVMSGQHAYYAVRSAR